MTDPKPPSERDEPQEQAKWYERTRYQILLFAGGIALFGLVLGLILDWYIDPQTSTQKKDLIQALALIIAGVAGAVGILFTWRGQQITQKSLADTRENTEENLRLTREGQITERFTRAIDQLGATEDGAKPKLETRLGGIYALERIDKESPERAYHGTVMEVLTAYVRENSRRDQEKPSTPKAASNEATEHDKGGEQAAEPTLRSPPTDIQAIVDVLKRREEDRVPEKHRVQNLDLRGTDLRGANLYGAHLEKAMLYGANLEGAIDLTSEQIEWAVGDKKTALREYLVDHRPSAWSRRYKEQIQTLQEQRKQEPKDE